MRVIAGKCRRFRLATLDGPDVRPTTDKIKETLFNMLTIYVPGARFLDIFAGSGGIGIEALSRGAEEAVFVERDRRAQAIIRGNIQHCGLTDDSTLLPMDYMAALKKLDMEGKPFDIIFMDPPYLKELEYKALEFIDQSSLIHEDTIIIVEAALATAFNDDNYENLVLDKEKIYKTNKHAWFSVKNHEK